MALIVAGGIVLAWPQVGDAGASAGGATLIAAACLCWALDNNLTRQASGTDALFIAGIKGLIAGTTNVVLAMALGASLPLPSLLAFAMAVGLLGYGASLVLFVLALRGLGSARCSAYFSTAPFLGAAIAVVAFHEPTSAGFWVTAALMAAGVALHISERHEHEHAHESMSHAHVHGHDAHHQHDHPFPWDGTEPHSHEHQHEAVRHRHPHFPDAHHRHGH